MTTTIEWAHAGLGRGETWNPIRARNKATGKIGWHCEKVSPACANCYAERQNMVAARGGTKLPYKPGHRLDVEIYLDEKTLLAPLHWKTPRGIFASSMTDLAADFVSDEWLDKMFAVAALCPQHIFIFLTKRSKRMREYIAGDFRKSKIFYHAAPLSVAARKEIDFAHLDNLGWPLPNVWLGVTAEDQQRADERIPDLLATPAAVRFVSYEPALGTVVWKRWLPTRRPARRPNGEPFLAPHFYMTQCEHCGWVGSSELCGMDSWGDDSDVYCPSCHNSICGDELPELDQVIAGGESGPNARPMHPDWARELRDQCAAAGVPFFFKQWGEWEPRDQWSGHLGGGHFVRMRAIMPDGSNCPDDAVPQDVGAHRMARVGKSRAGRTLDGREHNEFPEDRR